MWEQQSSIRIWAGTRLHTDLDAACHGQDLPGPARILMLECLYISCLRVIELLARVFCSHCARAAQRRGVDCDRRVLGLNRHLTIENHCLGIALPELYLKDIPFCTSDFFFQNKQTFQLNQFTCEHCGHCARAARRSDVDRDRRVLGQSRHSTQQCPINKVRSTTHEIQN